MKQIGIIFSVLFLAFKNINARNFVPNGLSLAKEVNEIQELDTIGESLKLGEKTSLILNDEPITRHPDEEFEKLLKKGEIWRFKTLTGFSNRQYWMKFTATALEGCGLAVKCSLVLPCKVGSLGVFMSPENELRSYYCTNNTDPITATSTSMGETMVILLYSSYSITSTYDCTVTVRDYCPIETTSTSTTAKPLGCQCGDSSVNRIINGSPVQMGEVPWQAGLQKKFNTDEYHTFCGGSLISDRYAVTTKHCVEYQTEVFRLQLGVLNRAETGVIVGIKHIVQYPVYSDIPYDWDIAVLFLDEVVDYSANIYPICLPPQGISEKFVDRIMMTSGWGKTQTQDSSQVLMKTRVKGIGSDVCATKFQPGRITDSMLCAVGNNTDACRGDSGGPLAFKDTMGVSFLAGIVSWGEGCNVKGLPGVYTRITSLTFWINKVTDGKVCTRRMYV